MKTRIIDETRRDDLETNVEQAVLDAIKHFSRRASIVTQGTLTPITAVVDQKEYDLPDDFSRMIGPLEITHDGITERMWPVTIAELDERDANTTDVISAIPVYYAIYGNQFSIYPRSSSVSYSFNGRYRTRFAAPADDDEEDNWWMNEAERPVRCFAKGILWDDVINDTDKADREFAKSEAEWSELSVEFEARAYEPGIRPWVV